MKDYYTFDEAKDILFGLHDSKEREEYEDQILDSFIGLAIKRAREAHNLTQGQLGEMIGVQKARISSIEKGANLRLSTLRRIFKALDMKVKLDIEEMTPVPIC